MFAIKLSSITSKNWKKFDVIHNDSQRWGNNVYNGHSEGIVLFAANDGLLQSRRVDYKQISAQLHDLYSTVLDNGLAKIVIIIVSNVGRVRHNFPDVNKTVDTLLLNAFTYWNCEINLINVITIAPLLNQNNQLALRWRKQLGLYLLYLTGEKVKWQC